MQTVPPFVLPTNLNFYWNNESTLTQSVNIYNPFTYDILFKVDNVMPMKFSVSLKQGIISSQKKLCLEVTCRNRELPQNDKLQIRFFKWPRPRQGAKPRCQQYIGFREVRLCVYNELGDRERTPSTSSDCGVSVGASSSAGGTSFGPTSFGSSFSYQQQQQHQQQLKQFTGDIGLAEGHHTSQKMQVLMNLGVTVILLLLGYLLDRTDHDWFSSNVLDGVAPHSLAVAFYTLACVLIIKLLTYR